ncbi:MAG: cysteine hydrolase [Cyclobacteriaceae bacterium]|nr:MAG: cysteine hydrolase [Cyclobacteriaceae bacterium]
MIYQLNRDEAALLVIDMQKGFIEEGAAMEVPPGREIIPNIQRLIDVSRQEGIPVIYTRFVYSTLVPNLIGELHPLHKPPTGCCMLGDPSVEIVEALTPQHGDLVVDKHGYNAFHHTSLDYALRSLGRNQLIFTGVMTDICVLSTITSALHYEYQLWAVSDATATLWPNVQTVTLDLVERAYGKVTHTEEILHQLAKS